MAACVRAPQPAEGVTYAHKIDKAEAAIDWSQPAAADRAPRARLRSLPRCDRRARGESDQAVARRAVPCAGAGRPGAVLAVAERHRGGLWRGRAAPVPSCSARAASACAVAEFLRGFALAAGQRFGESG